MDEFCSRELCEGADSIVSPKSNKEECVWLVGVVIAELQTFLVDRDSDLLVHSVVVSVVQTAFNEAVHFLRFGDYF